MKGKREVSGHDGGPKRPLGGQSRARRDAIEAALVEGQRRFLGFLIGRLGNADDAREVMQDFALRAIQRSDDLRHLASVRGWLSRLLASAVADHHRRALRRLRREVPGAPWSEDADPAPESDSEVDTAVCQCIGDVIDLLPPVQADLLRRTDLREEPRPDVARSLGITEGTLAVRLHRARSKLRDLLVEMCLTCPEHGFLDCSCDSARVRAGAIAKPAAGRSSVITPGDTRLFHGEGCSGPERPETSTPSTGDRK